MFFRLGCSVLLGAVSHRPLLFQRIILILLLLLLYQNYHSRILPLMDALVSIAADNPITLLIVILLTFRSRPSPWSGRPPYYFSCLLANGSLSTRPQGRSAVPSLFISSSVTSKSEFLMIGLFFYSLFFIRREWILSKYGVW